MARMRRISATVAMVLLWLVGLAAPAQAHSGSGVGATNYLTTLSDVSPEVEGIDVEVIEKGSRIQLSNATDAPATVLGYQGEPYLRVGPDGVFENRRSPATYLNHDREVTVPVPATADPGAEPEWEQIAEEPVARWHDHRTHWRGDQDPLAVRQAPDQEHVVIPDWAITVRTGETDMAVRGSLTWVPGPSPWPWIGLIGALFAVTLALVLARAGPRRLAAAVGVLVVVDAVHAVGGGFFTTGSFAARLVQTLSGSAVSIIGWLVGILAIVLLLRRKADGYYAAVIAGFWIFVYGGLTEFADLSRSQLPFLWAEDFARGAVATALGVGFSVVIASVLLLGRSAAPPAQAAPTNGDP